MATLFPFRAYRPRPELAAQVASVPYDVVDREEALALAAGNPRSFLHVTKPEIDLAASTDPYSEPVYAQGARALRQLITGGDLVADPAPSFYAYALTMNGHTQLGVVGLASVAEYDANIVRKHEFTRPDKENDRVRHIEVAGAQTGKVFLVHRDSPALERELQAVAATTPDIDLTAADGVRHRVWHIAQAARVAAIQQAYAALGTVYIADGHHRSAAASRVAAARRRGEADPSSPYERFLVVSFPQREVRILPYNRVVRDLHGRTPEQFLAELTARFEVTRGKPAQSAPRQFAMFLDGAWYGLRVKAGTFAPNDPVGRLDVSLLQNQLLEPLLGITDPRRDKRIDFVGGIRGEAELERRVAAGAAVAFSMHPTSLDELFAIADSGNVMPPKSTWFEPKLRDGLLVHVY